MKKRKVWWIVGGVLGIFVLYSAIASYVSWNSQDARMERAIGRILEENGLEYRSNVLDVGSGSFRSQPRWATYVGGRIGQENERQIRAQLQEACPECTVSVMKSTDNSSPPPRGYSGPTFDIHFWITPDYPTVGEVRIVFDDKGVRGMGETRASVLTVTRYRNPDPWSFLKSLWPW